MKRKQPKNRFPHMRRERQYDRVGMSKEAENYKKAGAIIGLLFMLLLIIGLVASLTGCAARKPAKAQHPTAQMEIPRECATGFQWTKKTVCKSVANDPEHAVCSNVLVRHWCVRPATK